VWYFINDAALLDPLDKRVSRTVIRDRQPQRILRLDDLNLLRSTFSVRENEIIETDLPTEQLRHVDFV
jgi:hypothetical protein